jgi:hypothetical protein
MSQSMHRENIGDSTSQSIHNLFNRVDRWALLHYCDAIVNDASGQPSHQGKRDERATGIKPTF